MENITEKTVDSNKTLEKITDLLYLQAPVSNATIIFLALLSFFILERYSDSALHIIWPLMMIVMALYRLFLWHQWEHQKNNTPKVATYIYWLNRYTFASATVGIIWSSLFFLHYTNYDLILYAFLLMVYFGVSASAVAILSVSLRAFGGYTFPIFFSFIIALYQLNDSASSFLIIVAITYYLMLTLFSININKQIIHSITLQLHNDRLIKQLHQEIEQRESLIKARTNQLELSNQQLLDSENRLQNVITASELGYWDWNYQTGVNVVNSRWLEILGLSRDDIEDNIKDLTSRIHPDDSQRTLDIIYLAIKKNKPYVADFRMKHKNGHWVWIEGAGAVIESDKITHEPLRLCGTHQDISYRKKIETKLEHQAKHDYLTNLYNRVELKKHFQNELARAERYHHNFSIFMIDIDHFKLVNDTYGHQSGDLVLKTFSLFLQDTVRETDYVARYGGEEFVVMLSETTIEEAEELAERLRLKTAALTIELNHLPFNITISIGIASYPEHGQSYDDIFNAADMAMYQAKKCGRNCISSAKL